MNTTTTGFVGRTARTLVRRLAGIVVATAALFLGFAVAGNAAPAHADTVAGSTVFVTLHCDFLVDCQGHAVDGNTQQAEWQRQQPHDGPQDQRQDGQRPAHHQQEAPQEKLDH